ncbi:NAD(P)H-hydrate dehydratase [Cellulomonas shaoxiangyii]|uniref:ADP-dependent (S)-NAD(P)H-hydrate dehydratase n=1 Tax=Cellulomonas shaoxiangyii TaxID=2566013 RepID=A0A4P7SRI8_9CELL|nr:NAD(P)H-hydrate dehydratase [Cellulomonas shaoxiangyii]TGY78287.1 NAD(P)H-hydrate dehydratase [Cellulomonas shaoxiangyii]
MTPARLRGWPLPEPTGGKDARGSVCVVGGARGTPGAAMLTGLAALRVGAGRLTLAVAGSVAPHVAVAVPEAGVVALPEDAAGSVTGTDDDGALARELARADVVVVGPGLDSPEGTLAVLRAVVDGAGDDVPLVLDAFALGVLRDADDLRDAVRGRAVLTPNATEVRYLLGDDDGPAEGEGALDGAAARAADRYGVVVACSGSVAAPDGRRWQSSTGYSGLGTSGSGDVLAGAVGGLLARGADPAHAACFGVEAHGTAGDRLAARVGPHGYLARELLEELPRVLVELRAR